MQKPKKKTSDALPMAHNVVLTPIDELLPYAANARTHSADQVKRIAASIKEFGFNNPILVDGAKGVIAGHGRLEAAKKLKLGTVPVIELAHLTDAQKRAYILADNRLALDAGWDDATLAVEMKRLQEDAFDLGLTGFSQEEIDKLLGATPVTEGITDEDDVPEDVPAICQRGQVWKLGRHRLMCGDSTSADDVTCLLAGKTDCTMITSPPYSNLREYGGGLDLAVSLLARVFDWPCSTFFINLGLKIKDRVIDRYWDEWIREAESRSLPMIAWLVWSKGNASAPAHQQAMFGLSHEWVFVFGKYRQQNRIKANKGSETWGHSTTREADGSLTSKSEGERRTHRQLDSVFELQCQKNFGADYVGHPAQFPVALPEQFILSHTAQGEVVCEPFGGSGTTLIACEKTGRQCFMMEIYEKYCDVIIARWEAFTGLKAELVQ